MMMADPHMPVDAVVMVKRLFTRSPLLCANLHLLIPERQTFRRRQAGCYAKIRI